MGEKSYPITFVAMRKYSYEHALSRARAYCDKAERAHWDVRNLLTRWGIPYHEREQIIMALIEVDVLNEARYAEAFTVDKFRFNKWGIGKIQQHLKAKGVSPRNIADAMKRIDPKEYRKSVLEIAQKQLEKHKGLQDYQKKQKTARYLISRGYDSSVVWEIMSEGF
jgi:regulatory protein